MTIRSKTRTIVAAGVGAGLMYLLDPDRGASRRAQTADQAKTAYRRRTGGGGGQAAGGDDATSPVDQREPDR
jgi:hypothetical protein